VPENSIFKDEHLGFHLTISGIMYTVVIFLWPVLMVISPFKGSDQEVLLMIADNPFSYKIIFINASFIAPLTVYLLMIYIIWLKKSNTLKIGLLFSTIFVSSYFLLVTIAYVSQYTLLPGLINSENSSLAMSWYFGSFYSIAYFLNQLGYAMLAIAGMLIGFHLLKKTGPPRWIGIMLWISGVLSLVAFSGLIFDSKMVNSLTVVGGIFVVPLGIVSLVWGNKLKKAGKLYLN